MYYNIRAWVVVIILLRAGSEISVKLNGTRLEVMCRYYVDANSQPPTSITLGHANTLFAANATNTVGADATACTTGIQYTNLQSSPTRAEVGGMAEWARLIDRYAQHTHCLTDTWSIDRSLNVIVDPISIYDLDDWICTIILDEETAPHIFTDTSLRAFHPAHVLHYNATHQYQNPPNIVVSTHPIDVPTATTTTDDTASMKMPDRDAVFCSVPGYRRSSALDFSLGYTTPYSYISFIYEQNEQALIGSGILDLQGELYGRQQTRGRLLSEYQRYAPQSIDHMCIDPPISPDTFYNFNPRPTEDELLNLDSTIHIYTADYNSDAIISNINKRDVLVEQSGGAERPYTVTRDIAATDFYKLTQTDIAGHPLTKCFSHTTIESALSPNSLDTHPMNTVNELADFVLVGDYFMREAVEIGKWHILNSNRTMIKFGSLWSVIPPDCPGSGCSELGIENFPYDRLVDSFDANKAPSHRLVFKMPEQQDLRPVQINDQLAYVRRDYGLPITRQYLSFFPNGNLTRDLYKAIIGLYRDYRIVQIRHSHDRDVSSIYRNTNCIASRGEAKTVVVHNGLCYRGGTQPNTNEWCSSRILNYDQKGRPHYTYNQQNRSMNWAVHEYVDPYSDGMTFYKRLNDKTGWRAGMTCMWRTYWCGLYKKSSQTNIMTREIILVEPAMPYVTQLIQKTAPWVTSYDECVYGQDSPPHIDIFLAKDHIFVIPHGPLRREYTTYALGANIGRDMLDMKEKMGVGTAVWRLPYMRYKWAWKGSNFPCTIYPATCRNTTIYSTGLIPVSSIAYITYNAIRFRELTEYTDTSPSQNNATNSLIWCDVMGVRSAKHRTRTLFTNYICRQDLHDAEVDNILTKHLALMPVPVLKAQIKYVGDTEYIHIACTELPTRCINLVGAISSITFIAPEGGLVVSRSATGEVSWKTLGLNIPKIADATKLYMPGGYDSINGDILYSGNPFVFDIFPEETTLAVYINKQILLSYITTIRCSYGYSGRVQSPPRPVTAVIMEAQDTCSLDDFILDVKTNAPHLISCTIAPHQGINSTCKHPVVRLWAEYAGHMVADITCSKSTNDYYFNQQKTKKLLITPLTTTKSNKYSKSYCLYNARSRAITAVLLPPPQLEASYLRRLTYKCVMNEAGDNGDLTQSVVYNYTDIPRGCTPPPSKFVPVITRTDTTPVSSVSAITKLACSYPDDYRGGADVICQATTTNISVVLEFESKLGVRISHTIGTLVGQNHQCVINKIFAGEDILCTYIGINATIFEVALTDVIFHNFVQYSPLSFKLQAYCTTNKNTRLPIVEDMLNLRDVAQRLRIRDVFIDGTRGVWRRRLIDNQIIEFNRNKNNDNIVLGAYIMYCTMLIICIIIIIINKPRDFQFPR